MDIVTTVAKLIAELLASILTSKKLLPVLGQEPAFFFVFAVWSFLLLGRLKTSQADRKVSELPFPAQTEKKTRHPPKQQKKHASRHPPSQKKAPAQTGKQKTPEKLEQQKKTRQQQK